VEFLLGYKRAGVMKYLPNDSPAHATVERRLCESSIVDHFYDFLERCGVSIPDDLRNRDVTEPAIANEHVQEGLLRLYKTRPDLVILLELMMDFDEGLQEWRYRHVKIVERTIGSKHGTGGSPGVEFLKKSLFMPVFADLWAIRHKL
jgi:tryptophan 2,3-dioxygenase